MSYVITIGREYGSGGRYIAQELAKRLNIKFYDNELLNEVVKHSGLCLDYLIENEEKKDSIFSFIAMNGGINSLSPAQKVALAQFETIKKLADSENCVIVGRCADYVLKNHPNVINIFITAPMEDKILRAIKYYGIDEKNAEKIIKKKNKKRASYYAYFTDQKWGHAENYDLCINFKIGIEQSVDIIIELLKHSIDLK